MMWRQLYIHKKNDLVGLLSHTLEQINSTWTKNPTITAKPRNFFKENSKKYKWLCIFTMDSGMTIKKHEQQWEKLK